MTGPTIFEIKDVLAPMLTVAGSVGTSMIVTYAWVRAKFAANDVQITNIMARLDRRDEAIIRENTVISRELMEMKAQNTTENNEIKNLITNIRLTCVKHDGILTNLGTVIDYAIKEIGKHEQHQNK